MTRRTRHRAVMAAGAAAVALGACNTNNHAEERRVLRAVMGHALFAVDPPGALQPRTSGVGTSRDLIESTINGGFLEKTFYSTAAPLPAVLDVARHAVATAADIAAINCYPGSPSLRGVLTVDGRRHGFAAAATDPKPAGEILETGRTEAPAGALAFVRLSSIPELTGPGLDPVVTTTVECTTGELPDAAVRAALGPDARFVRVARR